MEQPESPPIAPQPADVAPKKAGPPLKLIGIIVSIVLLILLAVMGVLVGIRMVQKPLTPKPTPVPTATPIPTIVEIMPVANPKYASNSAYLEIRNSLRTLNQEIGTANFFEPEISPPSIDLKISIK